MSKDLVHVIACGVLAVDIRHIARELNLDIKTTFLPGGLHNDPKELRKRLQAAIDEISAAGEATQIAIGYGVCGRGAVGIHARGIPLSIPRVHDCIALFLGSDAAYRREFAKYPGTYYISAGWVQEKVQPNKAPDACSPPAPASDPRQSAAQDSCTCADPEFQKLVAQHGQENAEAIAHFLSSWQRNYQRAAFIDTGATEHQRYARIAQDMASRYGWKYEQLQGSGDLLKTLLACRTSSPEVLWVPANHVTIYDPVVRGLEAVPVWKANLQDDEAADQIIDIGTDTPSAGDHVHLGLGIDAGGTYTDVVLYDFSAETVIQKAKSLTTKWDYTIGITGALDQLDPALLTKVDLVSVSTTLATNAIVEGRGQNVGLLVMPPYGLLSDDDIAHRPVRAIEGQLDIDGSELQKINPDQIRQIARTMIQKDHVGAFAVTGYASHMNPAHEMQVRDIIRKETGLPVTCGHEVSEQLNYRVRAHTAALNARIIPILVSFLDQASQGLRQRGITAPMMVVRSDGSLMSVQVAQERPIETILSGPAASVAGARYLAKTPSAFVVDVGGTTTDTALITQGEVRTTRRGARVGGWQTHVQALDMRATGLGGDSHITFVQDQLKIGPRRVGPIAWLATTAQNVDQCLTWISTELREHGPSSGLFDIYTLNSAPPQHTLSDEERAIVQTLSTRPHCAIELATRINGDWWETLSLDRLEREHIIQRCGLTPTDLLHVTGAFTRWDTAAATRMADIVASALRLDTPVFTQKAIDLFVQQLAMEILKKQLDDQTEADDIDQSEVAATLMANWLQAKPTAPYQVRICLKTPVIGIGAPVGHFLPAAARLLETQAIIPDHADVANAIGAITSSVTVHRRVEICPDINGRYILRGVKGSPVFVELTKARAAAIEALRESVTAAARSAGTSHSRIRFTIHDNIAASGEGGHIFVGETIEARLIGRPDLARASLTAGAA